MPTVPDVTRTDDRLLWHDGRYLGSGRGTTSNAEPFRFRAPYADVSTSTAERS